jgi:hypothetical protein
MSASRVGRREVYSRDRLYCYQRFREWNQTKPRITFVGLHPPETRSGIDDALMRQEILLAKRWGFGRLIEVNLFARMATDAPALASSKDPIGTDNDDAIVRAAIISDMIVCAWGAAIPTLTKPRAEHVIGLLRPAFDLYAYDLVANEPRSVLYCTDHALECWLPSTRPDPLESVIGPSEPSKET